MFDYLVRLIFDNIVWVALLLPLYLIYGLYEIVYSALFLLKNNRQGLSNGPSKHYADRFCEVYYSDQSNIKTQYGNYSNPNYPQPYFTALHTDNELLKLGYIEKVVNSNILTLKKDNWKLKVKNYIIYKILKLVLINIYKDNPGLYL